MDLSPYDHHRNDCKLSDFNCRGNLLALFLTWVMFLGFAQTG